MKKFVFNPINNKIPRGACLVGTQVGYSLKVSKFEKVDEAYFVVHMDGEEPRSYPMSRAFVDDRYINFIFAGTFEEIGFYWYHFEIKIGDRIIRLNRSHNLDVTENGEDSDFLQLIIGKQSQTDSSYRKGIIYHIFVDRFCRVGEVKARKGLNLIKDWNKPVELEYNDKGERCNNNCYGGNFAGIIEKLPYLKSLNVGTIYLSPIFEANSSHKYDVADYSKIDSMFGTNEEFTELIKQAKRLDMHIIIDGVFNHTGSDSVYFNKEGRYKTIGAYQSKNSKYYNWYEFASYPDDYSCWWGIKSLPQTREDSGFYDYIAGKNGIIEKYMSMGLGGFRLDVVDELSNEFLHSICRAARKIEPNALIVGEVWEDASSKVSYNERKKYFLGGNLDSVTNYPMKNAILQYIKYGDESQFVNTVRLILDQYPRSVQHNLMNVLDSHDTQRALTFLGANDDDRGYAEGNKYILSESEREKGVKLLKLATIMQYTVVGIPTVFYGDEAGIEGMKDPYCRATYPWGKEDVGLVEWYQKLGNLRNNKVLVDGEMKLKYASDSVIIYERVKDDSKIIVAINRSEKPFEFVVKSTMFDFFTGDSISGKITLEPDSAVVLC